MALRILAFGPFELERNGEVRVLRKSRVRLKIQGRPLDSRHDCFFSRRRATIRCTVVGSDNNYYVNSYDFYRSGDPS